MPKTDRRHPENTQLREKINRIKDVSQQLVTLIDHVQNETVAWARAGQVSDLPNVALAARLTDAFQEQRSAISRIQHDISGTDTKIKSAPLITDAEITALMR